MSKIIGNYRKKQTDKKNQTINLHTKKHNFFLKFSEKSYITEVKAKILTIVLPMTDRVTN